MRGIVERPVVSVYLAGEDRTGLVGVAADCDHGIDRLGHELVPRLRAMVRDIDADLFHSDNSERVNVASGLGPGADDVEEIAGSSIQNAFCKMTAARVARAKDEDRGLVHTLRK